MLKECIECGTVVRNKTWICPRCDSQSFRVTDARHHRLLGVFVVGVVGVLCAALLWWLYSKR
jgi:hypothetical protein